MSLSLAGIVPSKAGSEAVPVEQLPESVQYLLIGAGTASVSAMRAILKSEPNAEVGK